MISIALLVLVVFNVALPSLLAVVVVMEVEAKAAAAFSTTTPTPPTAKRNSNSAIFSEASSSSRSNSKVEDVAIQRFTKGYDKLCKTCPTLLQPRILTLEAMIMGLPIEERDELLANVAQRIIHQYKEDESEQEVDSKPEPAKVQSSQDVYKFQTGVDARLSINNNKKKTPKNDGPENNLPKLQKKMQKARSKFEASKFKRNQIQQLLERTDALLAAGGTGGKDLNGSSGPLRLKINDDDTSSSYDDDTDPFVYHQMDEFKTMSRRDMKFQRLKYMAQKAKYEQRMAKCRSKLYATSLLLAETE